MDAEPIEDPRGLCGQTVTDQVGKTVGTVKKVYAVGDDEAPMWVMVESSTGLLGSKDVFIPIARLKSEDGKIRVPYSAQHVQDAPEIEADDELSERDDRSLRNYYAIDLGDHEIRTDNDSSYAAQVPDADGPARQISED